MVITVQMLTLTLATTTTIASNTLLNLCFFKDNFPLPQAITNDQQLNVQWSLTLF